MFSVTEVLAPYRSALSSSRDSVNCFFGTTRVIHGDALNPYPTVFFDIGTKACGCFPFPSHGLYPFLNGSFNVSCSYAAAPCLSNGCIPFHPTYRITSSFPRFPLRFRLFSSPYHHAVCVSSVRGASPLFVIKS